MTPPTQAPTREEIVKLLREAAREVYPGVDRPRVTYVADNYNEARRILRDVEKIGAAATISRKNRNGTYDVFAVLPAGMAAKDADIEAPAGTSSDDTDATALMVKLDAAADALEAQEDAGPVSVERETPLSLRAIKRIIDETVADTHPAAAAVAFSWTDVNAIRLSLVAAPASREPRVERWPGGRDANGLPLMNAENDAAYNARQDKRAAARQLAGEAK